MMYIHSISCGQTQSMFKVHVVPTVLIVILGIIAVVSLVYSDWFFMMFSNVFGGQNKCFLVNKLLLLHRVFGDIKIEENKYLYTYAALSQ